MSLNNCPRLVFVSLSFVLTIFFSAQINFGQIAYAVSDTTNQLVVHNHATGVTTVIGATGRSNIEAIAWQASTVTLFAADEETAGSVGRLGVLNRATGAFTGRSNTFGSGNGSLGSITFFDVDALSFDPTDGTLYGVHRRGTAGQNDVLFKINPTTGQRIANGFGAGVDYVVVTGTLADIDEIAISSTGIMYAIANDSGSTDRLVTINKTTGAATEISNPNLGVNDMEGLAFATNGVLYGSTGNASTPTANNNSVWTINTSLGTATLVNAFTAGGDYEALAYNISPQAVKLMSFEAKSDGENILLEWQTGQEIDNLGYNVIREDEAGETLLTSSLIAGSALITGQGIETTGSSYQWTDRLNKAKGTPRYWLETIDIDGSRERFGPVSVEYVSERIKPERNSRLINELSQNSFDIQKEVPTLAFQNKSNADRKPFSLNQAANGQAIKLYINKEGWYRVSREQLIGAGLSAKADSSRLQLSLNGVEQPILVNTDGSIEFYANGVDKSETDTQVYWLTVGNSSGRRISVNYTNNSVSNFAEGFSTTVSRQERTLYFAALLNGDENNFFGSVIGNTPVTKTLNVRHLNQSSNNVAMIEISTVGVTWQEHKIQVQLNGTTIGVIESSNRDQNVWRAKVDAGLLREAENKITLVSIGDGQDISLFDTVRLTYSKRYVAENGLLDFSIDAGQSARLTGFATGNVRVFDVTNPSQVQEIVTKAEWSKEGVSVLLSSGSLTRRLLAFDDSAKFETPSEIKANAPSNLSKQGRKTNLIVIAPREFHEALQPLLEVRKAQGFRVLLADVEDIFDEFSYGQHSAQAIKDFLKHAKSNGLSSTSYLLLVGDSSYDPRNYLGAGSNDFVPTKIVDTSFLTTASDDWLADFDEDGIPEFGVGRLPVRTSAEVSLLVNKMLAYERQSARESDALFVSDREFAKVSEEVAMSLPSNTKLTKLSRESDGDEEVRANLLDALQKGRQIVNFTGHGSLANWTSGALLKSSDAATLSNQRLSFFVMLSCMNNYSHDALVDSLGEALLKAERGGAIAVWGSSGMSYSEQQTVMAQTLYQTLFNTRGVRFGDAIKRAKATAPTVESRMTLQFFGDPTMQIR